MAGKTQTLLYVITGKNSTGPAIKSVQRDFDNLNKSLSVKGAGISAAILGGLATLPVAVGGIAAVAGVALGAGLVKASVTSLQAQKKTLLAEINKLQQALTPVSPVKIASDKLAISGTQATISRLAATKNLTAAQKSELSIARQRLAIQQQTLAADQSKGQGTSAQQAQLAADKQQLAELNKQLSVYNSLTSAATRLKNTAIQVFGKAVTPLIGPFTSALQGIGAWLKANQGLFRSFFTAAAPYVPLITGFFEGLIETILPQITNLMQKGRQPFALMLGDFTGLVNSGIVPLFQNLGNSLGPSVTSFGLILQAVTPLVPLLGILASGAAKFVSSIPVGTIQGIALGFAGLKVASVAAGAVLGLIGVFGKFKEAAKALKEFNLISKLTFLTNPWVILGVAVAAAAILIVKYWGPISNFFVSLWKHVFSGFITPFVNFFVNTVPHAFGVALNHVEVWGKDVGNFFVAAWHAVSSGFVSPIGNFFTRTLPSWFHTAIGFLNTVFVKPWEVQFQIAVDTAKRIFNSVKGFFLTTIPGWFHTAVGKIGAFWNDLKNIIEAPVKFVFQHVLDPLASGFDKITNALGLGHPIPVPLIPGFATGGRINAGTSPTADDVLIRVSRGEAVLSAAHTRMLAPVLGAAGVPGFASGGLPFGGGVLSDIGHGITGAAKAVGHAVGSVVSKAIDVGKITAALVTGNTTALANALGNLIGSPAASGAAGEMLKVITAVPKTLIGDAVKWLVSHFVPTGGPGGGPLGGATGAPSANAREGFAYLLANVFGGVKAAAAGATASIWGESTWNPFAQGTGGRGLIGWTPPGTISNADFEGGMRTQLPAIVRFISTSGDWGVIARMKSAGAAGASVTALAEMWGKGVERYGIDDVHPFGVRLASQIAGLKNGGLIGARLYDNGGILPPGLTMAFNGTGHGEYVSRGNPGGGGDGRTVNYNITIETAFPASSNQMRRVGTEIVHCIQQYEKGSGSSWRR